MHITQVDIYIYKLDQHYKLRGVQETPGLLPGTDYYFEPHWRQAYSQKVESCLIKLTTDTGLVGWGEAQAPILPEPAASVIKNLVGPFLLGKDPLRRAWIYDQLYHINNVRGHGTGFMLDAIAAADIALWDLAGKYYDAPVCELMGGPFSHELTAYISGLRQPTLEEQCQAASQYMAEGYAGIKLFPGENIENTIREVRKAAGPNARLYCDLLWRCRLDEALRLGRILDAERYEFFEAPLPPEDIAGHQKLVQSLDIPIAIGEPLRTAYEFQSWFDNGALGVAQPDVVRTGLTSALKISALAEARRIPVAPHVGVCTGIGMAATWQLAASVPNFLIQEFQFELAERANTILKTPLEWQGGKLIVPMRPGLGVEIDEAALTDVIAEQWTIG
ncbi:MAG: mandelate racemase/muconate lactonizing enzyme family protein [Candidatus Latescibacteria bacterium]|nr:mandelate racemase/muconate lactonizing enzyme family protein [Candidatus Latescibacterota bacterium]